MFLIPSGKSHVDRDPYDLYYQAFLTLHRIGGTNFLCSDEINCVGLNIDGLCSIVLRLLVLITRLNLRFRFSVKTFWVIDLIVSGFELVLVILVLDLISS